MVPDKFNMVDMEGIDIIYSQGIEVPGLWQKLVESIAQCRYQVLYNWVFNGVQIPPTLVELETDDNDNVVINDGITITDEDILHIYSLEVIIPPSILSLSVTENGVYTAPSGVDGYSPVSVSVPDTPPVITSIAINQNGTYTAPSGVDGYSPIVVEVPQTGQYISFHYGKLAIDTGVITEDNDYCYSDLIPIETSAGRWYLDISRSDFNSYYTGLCFYGQDEETIVDYIRQYTAYRAYNNSGGTSDAKFFRIAGRVSDLSFMCVLDVAESIFVHSQNYTTKEINLN